MKNKLKEVKNIMEETIVLKRYTCERCGHKWLPRREEKPRVCPNCNSPYWDRPRQNSIQKMKNAKH